MVHFCRDILENGEDLKALTKEVSNILAIDFDIIVLG